VVSQLHPSGPSGSLWRVAYSDDVPEARRPEEQELEGEDAGTEGEGLGYSVQSLPQRWLRRAAARPLPPGRARHGRSSEDPRTG